MRKLEMSELNRLSVEDFKQSSKNEIVVVLDNVRSLLNVGSVFRTADSFRAKKVYLCGLTPKPNNEMRKTALGATESVEWEYFEETAEALKTIQKDNYQIVAIEQAEGSLSLEQAEFQSEPTAFIFGNEVVGVSDEALALSNKCIEIPQFGTKHSLNISVSAGIVLWEYICQKLKH